MSDNIQEIKSIVDQIDKLVPKDNIAVEYEGWDDSPVLISTQEGLVRLGVDLLKGAFIEENKECKSGITNVAGGEYFPDFKLFYRSEELKPAIRKDKIKDFLGGILMLCILLGFIAFVLFLIVSLFYGLYDIMMDVF